MNVDVAVIDYGMGNLRSVSKAIEHVAPAASVMVTSDPDIIASAGRVVFPGQGAAPDCMRDMLDSLGYRTQIAHAVVNHRHINVHRKSSTCGWRS